MLLIGVGCDKEGVRASPAIETSPDSHATVGSCDPGGAAAIVAKQPKRDWPPPPQPRITTGRDVGCAERIAFCVSWVRNCAMIEPLFLPERPVLFKRADEVLIDFSAPVRRLEEQVETGEICETSVEPVDANSRTWRLHLPDSIWDDDPRGCGRDGELEGSVLATYGPERTFAGYRASFGFWLRELTQ